MIETKRIGDRDELIREKEEAQKKQVFIDEIQGMSYEKFLAACKTDNVLLIKAVWAAINK